MRADPTPTRPRDPRGGGGALPADGRAATELFAPGSTVLTHCNTGGLATGGYGTALGAIRAAAWERGLVEHVLVDETRPLLQGARLTAWELDALGIPFSVIADGAAAALIASGEADAVLVGADRIATNGDMANKVGTYALRPWSRIGTASPSSSSRRPTLDARAASGAGASRSRSATPPRSPPLPGAEPGVRRDARRADRRDRDRGGVHRRPYAERPVGWPHEGVVLAAGYATRLYR